MKLIAFIILLCFLFGLHYTTEAQSSGKKDSSFIQHRNVISLLPLAFATSSFMMGYERAVSDKIGLRAIGSYGNADHFQGKNLDHYRSYHAEGQVKFYPLGNAPSGFYAGGYLLYKHIDFNLYSYNLDSANHYYSTDTVPGGAQAVSFGVLFGYQLIVNKYMALDAFVGGGPNIPSGDYHEVYDNTIDSYSNGMVFKIGIAIGIAF